MEANRDPTARHPHHSPPRARHRARSHESAHADQIPADESRAGPDHPLVPRGGAPVVVDDAALSRLIEQLRSVGVFAYDSEFIGELTYFPKLCLIQVSTSKDVALIDPLAPSLNLEPFWALVADPSVEKVVHAGQQDIEPVIRLLGRPPANIFDTQVAAGFSGLPYPVSLSKLVCELTGARLGKGLTFSHWDQRPLSPIQLRYAADDVRYLPLVREELRKRLDGLGHARWVREECQAMCDTSLYRFDPQQQYLRVRGAGSLMPRNLAVLRELTAWRDAAAREHDVPPRTFLKDEILLDLARNPVKSVEKLDNVRGLPRPVEHTQGPEIVAATARAMQMPESQLPLARETDPSPAEKFHADALWATAQVLCAGRAIDPALVTSRQEIGEFHRKTLGGEDGRASHPLLSGWRFEALGKPLSSLLRGESRLDVRWAAGALSTKTQEHGDI